MAQRVKCLHGMQETRVRPLGPDLPWRSKWQPTPVLLPGESHGRRILVGHSPRGRKESDTTDWLHFLYFLSLKSRTGTTSHEIFPSWSSPESSWSWKTIMYLFACCPTYCLYGYFLVGGEIISLIARKWFYTSFSLPLVPSTRYTHSRSLLSHML